MTPTINCPAVRDKLPGIPSQAVEEVNRDLTLLDKQIAEANQRLVATQGQDGPNFVDNAILGPLKDKRTATIDRIAIAIGRNGARPTGLERLASCTLNNAKPTSRGPANARATWTCSGFTDRLSAKYVICPTGSQVMRVHDFPSCWDGRNTDSDNHRAHIAFPDSNTGACPAGTKAVPQLRISIAYDLPADVQQKGQYQLDSFPEENHNPFSDHNDFANVNSDQAMAKITDCVNTGKQCT